MTVMLQRVVTVVNAESAAKPLRNFDRGEVNHAMPERIRWPNVAAGDRDEMHQLAEESKRLLSDAQRESNPDRQRWLLAEIKVYQERIARLAERNGSKQ